MSSGSREERLQGLGVSEGLAIGRAVCTAAGDPEILRIQLEQGIGSAGRGVDAPK